MNVIKLEPGHEPEIITVVGMEGIEDLLSWAAPYGTTIDPAGLYIAFASEAAQYNAAEDGYYNRYGNELLYGTAIVTRHDHRMTPTSVHAKDLGRVAGLLQPVDAFEEVS